jgi:rhodanese-related sulfurtransferase
MKCSEFRTDWFQAMYKGDIPPAEAHERLVRNPQAVLIDVRTEPEWAFVGVPAVDRLIRLSWQAYPQMQVNADFVKQVEDSGIAKDAEILCICRSGARSANAAAALTKAGFTNCWNVAQGFEGDRDGQGHRGTIGGWKAAGLPWIQS